MAADLPIRSRSSPWDPQTFDELYSGRAGLGGLLETDRIAEETRQRALDLAYLRAQHGVHFDPRPELLSRITDERGMTPEQAMLKRQYMHGRVLAAGMPFDPEAPSPPVTALAREAGADLIPWKSGPFILDQEKTATPNPTVPPLPRPKPDRLRVTPSGS